MNGELRFFTFGTIAIAVVTTTAIIAMTIESYARSGNWQQDCDAYGMHKHGSTVYICTKKEPKQ